MGLSQQEFIAKQRQLLVMEKCEEDLVARQLTERKLLKEICSSGSAISSLRFESVKVGLLGRYLVKFSNRNNVQLPAHKLTPGDTVSIAFVSHYRNPIVTGVVNKIKDTSLSVALETEPPFEQGSVAQKSFCLIKMSNDVTHRRLLDALERLEHFEEFAGGHFVNYLLNNSIPIPSSESEVLLHDFLNVELNESQKNAVRFALNPQRPVTLIHGPPGTGKTTVIVEIVRQSLLRGEKILVCAPSNVAVDNIMAKLSKHMLRGSLIRLGHPARLERSILPYSIDSVIKTSDDTAILQDVRRDIDKNLAALRKASKLRKAFIRKELTVLFREFKQREKGCLKKTLGGARVICSTLVTAAPNGPLQVLDTLHNPFSLVVIDECAQALEVACWIPLLQAKRCVLVGDHCQLPPTIISDEAEKNGLSVTLMERILQMFSGQHSDVMCLLSIQYRMNSDIMQWSSSQLYDNKLEAGEIVSSHLLSDFNGVACTEETSASLWLIDTDGCDMNELNVPEESSKANIYEAKLVAIHIEALLAAGVPQDCISVISPYNLQVAILRRLLSSYAKINVRSVDGFQGQENDVILLSLVRSNQQRKVGFLADIRRLNVAVTRPRRHLCIICDSKTVTKLQFVRTLCDHIKSKGVVKSAFEYEGRLNNFVAAGDFSDLIETAEKENVKIVEVEKVKKKVGSGQAKSKEPRAVPSFHVEGTITLIGTKDAGHLRCGAEEKSEIRLLIDNFMNNSAEDEFKFSPRLTSFQRRIVHDIAEELNIAHYSSGDGNERFVVIRKQTIDAESTIAIADTTFPGESSFAQEEYKQPPKASASSKSHAEPQKLQPRKPKPKKVQKSAAPTPDAVQSNVEELLQQFEQNVKHCGLAGCKESIVLLGQKCQFCSKVFCFRHLLAEVHGCGDAAKAFARATVRKEASGVAAAPKPSQKLTDKRQELQQKLDKKIVGMKLNRTVQSKDSKH